MKSFDSIFAAGTTKYIVFDDIPNFGEYFSKQDSVVIIDENVLEYFEHYFDGYKIIVYTGGEQSKRLSQVEFLINAMIDLGVDRSFKVIAVGGGVVCDVASFAATIYMRGLKRILIPTTLLSQVDASIGGKTGVNLNSYKNMIGTIVQPELILSCARFLNTLPEIEFKNGLGEIIKTALVASPALFDFIELNVENILKRKKETLSELIFNCAEIKSQIVADDEFESGRRRILNFGHTLGHAIELTNKIPHGLAVVAGMVKALQISQTLSLIEENQVKRILELIQRLQLPIFENYKIDDLLDLISRDKKNYSGKVKFILLKGVGRPKIMELSLNDIKRYAN